MLSRLGKLLLVGVVSMIVSLPLYSKANIVEIGGLNATINYYTWTYSDDAKLIGYVKKEAAKADATGKIKASMDRIGFQFFLFEFPMTAQVKFNSNINLLVEDLSRANRPVGIDEYMKLSRVNIKKIIKGSKVINTKIKNINGFSCGLQELHFIQNVRGQNLKLISYQMVVIKDKKAFVFSGTTLSRMFKSKKSSIEKIFFSLKKR